jgi:hypothetical protein
MGIEDKRKADAERQDKRRQRLAAVGIRPMTVQFPEADRPLVRDLSRHVLDGQPIRQAMRALGGSNELISDEASAELRAELEALRNRVAEVESEAKNRQAEIETVKGRERALLAQRDAALVAESSEREKAETAMAEARTASDKAVDAEGRASGTLRRAKAAEKIVRKVQDLPGVRGWLVRWLAGAVLEQQVDNAAETEAKFP